MHFKLYRLVRHNVYLKFLKPAKDQIEEGEKDGRTVTLCKLV